MQPTIDIILIMVIMKTGQYVEKQIMKYVRIKKMPCYQWKKTKKLLQKELNQLALIDKPTGLKNRNCFLRDLECFSPS